jgi:CotH kinase protein
VRTRLRGGNSRYGDNEGRFPRGKRHYKFQFNDGHRFQARDQSGKKYPQKWSSLAINKMFGNKGGNGWGMPEEIGATLWKTFGVPAANTHWFHFRVIDGAGEAPDQYNGDFWGIQQVIEEYEGTFLEARGMAKGNLYKMSDWIWDSERQRRYQSPDMVRDGSEFNNIRDNLHGGQNAAWLQQYNKYDSWYRYSAVAEAIRHYDIFPYTDDIRHALKNIAWYFEPTGPDPTRGVCWWLPYDWDASFGPNWNNGWEHANNALYGWDMSTSDGMPYIDKPAMKLEHRNVLREFRDLVWQEDQVNRLIDDRSAVISEISKADQDRWRNAPQASGTANDDPLIAKVEDMKRFCFTGWFKDNGNIGPGVPNGRDAYLDTLADSADSGQLPAKPVISYNGAPNHPINGLSFLTNPYADPQGAGTFAAMAWRIGEIEDTSAPAYNPSDEFIMEYTPVWESGALASFSNNISIPAGALKPGHTYRARVRMKDNTGRWSHWSTPYQFTTTTPDDLDDLQQNLMITEVMYNPIGPALPLGSKEDFEYVELRNISSTLTLDLTNVRFTKGLDFDFAGSAITSLAPGDYALVVKNLIAFEARYGTGKPIAGTWDPLKNLSNGGEQIKLSYGSGVTIHDFIYDDIAPWPTSADGAGSAMILLNPESAPDHAIGANWIGGPPTPGDGGEPEDPFADWLAAQGASDPMTEIFPGMTYLMSYAIGGDLAADPHSVFPVAGYSEDVDGTHLTLSFRKRIDATQVDYLVETSTTFDEWLSGPGTVETVGVPVNNGDGTETITVRVVATVADNPVRFIRLRVSLNE